MTEDSCGSESLHCFSRSPAARRRWLRVWIEDEETGKPGGAMLDSPDEPK